MARPLIQPEVPISSEPQVRRAATSRHYLLREEETLDALVRHVKASLPDANAYLRIEYQRGGPDSTALTFKSEDASLPDRTFTVTIAQDEKAYRQAYLNPYEFSKAYFDSFQPDTYD